MHSTTDTSRLSQDLAQDLAPDLAQPRHRQANRHSRTTRATRSVAVLVPLLLLGGGLSGATPSALAAGRTPSAVSGSLVGSPLAPRTQAQVRSAAAAPTGPIDTRSQAAVRAAYAALWVPAAQTPVAVSGGSTSSCTTFGTSATAQQATQNAVNLARGLAGENGVTFQAGYSNQAAAAALIMAASGKLSHSPDGSFNCVTSTGKDAAGRSNILIDSTRPPTAARVAELYLDEPGANTAVGHRRWLLRPEATTMGSGNAQGDSWFGNAIYAFTFGDDNAGAPARAYYAWPSAGFFPNQLEPQGRWSLSSSTGASFAGASVSVTGPSGALPVRRYDPETGYGDNTLAFDVGGVTPSGTYTVTVNGIRGGPAPSYTYYVRLFDPNAGGDLVLPVDANNSSVATHTTIKVRKKVVRRHHKVRIRLWATAANGARPSGRFVIYVGKHKVKAVTLRASARTTQMVTLRFGSSGRKRVHAVFVPYGGYSASASPTVRVRVR